MLLPILLSFFTAFLALAFALFLGSSLATFSLILYFFLPIVTLSLWMIGCGLICYGAYWNGKHKKTSIQPAMSFGLESL